MNTHRGVPRDSEPAITVGTVTAAVTAIIALLVALGIPITDDLKVAVIGVVAAGAPIVAALITRPRVTPNGSVVERIADGRVIAGEGSELTTGTDIRAAGSLEVPDAD